MDWFDDTRPVLCSSCHESIPLHDDDNVRVLRWEYSQMTLQLNTHTHIDVNAYHNCSSVLITFSSSSSVGMSSLQRRWKKKVFSSITNNNSHTDESLDTSFFSLVAIVICPHTEKVMYVHTRVFLSRTLKTNEGGTGSLHWHLSGAKIRFGRSPPNLEITKWHVLWTLSRDCTYLVGFLSLLLRPAKTIFSNYGYLSVRLH